VSSKVRIATVSETGQRHIIDRIDFRAGIVHCLPGVSKVSYDRHSGELAKVFYRSGSIKVSLDAVSISEASLDKALAVELLEQDCKARGAQVITGREQAKRRRQGEEARFRAALGTDLASSFNKILGSL
jgi:hypothetical protein